MAQSNITHDDLARVMQAAMALHQNYQVTNPPHWAALPIQLAAGLERWKEKEWKKLTFIKLAKYSHMKAGVSWSGHKADLQMQFMSVHHDRCSQPEQKWPF
ncbi:MAG: hypothetical protein GY696_18395 [Gammaproteobacteria bacterium]|nr:hypothetical protein [Gammaproteobacteria bacterium]